MAGQAAELTAPAVAPYPHEGACQECRAALDCNYCGGPALRATRCTNGRCSKCHATICTPGGVTESGHGFGEQGGKHFA